MIDSKQLTFEIDNLNYTSTVVLKLITPFTTTLAQRVPPATWFLIVHNEEDMCIAVIPKRTPQEKWEPLVQAAENLATAYYLL